jgi:hypothetical protein
MKRRLLSFLLPLIVVVCLQSCSDTSSYPSYSVLSKPSISATKIDAILCKAGSPACKTGQALYDLGVESGINPAVALAFFKHESTYGLYGVARATRSLGNIRCSQGYACVDGFRAYSSWQSGYEDWYGLIAFYCHEWNKCTVGTIVPTYAPSSENDTSAYIRDVCASVDEYRGM